MKTISGYPTRISKYGGIQLNNESTWYNPASFEVGTKILKAYQSKEIKMETLINLNLDENNKVTSFGILKDEVKIIDKPLEAKETPKESREIDFTPYKIATSIVTTLLQSKTIDTVLDSDVDAIIDKIITVSKKIKAKLR